MIPVDRPARRTLLALAAAAFVLRAAFGLLYWVDKPLTHDEREYLALARSVAAGRGFTYDTSEPVGTGQRFGRAPGYPAFLALIGAGGERPDGSPTVVKLAQAGVGAVTVVLIGLVARQAAGPGAGVAAAALAAVYPPLVWITAYVFSETLFSAVALLAATVLQGSVDRGAGGRGRAAAAGALTGLAVLIRPAMIFFIPLAVVWLAAGRRWRLALLFVAAAAAVVAPWTVRNARVHGRLVLVASEGGVTFWTGNHPLARGEGDLAANPELKRAELAFRARHPGLSSDELEPLYYRDAISHIAADPLRWGGLVLRKAFYTVVPAGPSYTLHSAKYLAASVVSYLVVLGLAVAGAGAIWRSARRPSAVLLLGASAVLAGLVFFPQERFRIPVIDPVLIIAAAPAAARLIRVRGAA